LEGREMEKNVENLQADVDPVIEHEIKNYLGG
jgi:hypothetical protein